MKKIIFFPVLAILIFLSGTARSQEWPEEYLGLPGDNLNLYAVMDIFQQSETLEAFEKSLNDPELIINNLDLDGDNYVDYIMVFDYKQDDIHHIVLRVALNQDEYQDVAVFTVERFRDGSVQIQLIGDEALYGPNYIIEPHYAERPNPGYTGRSSNYQETNIIHTTTYEVATWPVIVYIFHPAYVVWRSNWHYGYYPGWWNPWRTHYWHYYYGYHYHSHVHYYAYYRPWRHHRCGFYKNYYITHVRHYSPQVTVMVNTGRYKTTYSKPELLAEGKKQFQQRNPNGRPMPVAAERKIQSENSPAAVNQKSRRPASAKESAPTAIPVEARKVSDTPAARKQIKEENGKQQHVAQPNRRYRNEQPAQKRPQAEKKRERQENKSVERWQKSRNTTTPEVRNKAPERHSNRSSASTKPKERNNRHTSVERSSRKSNASQPSINKSVSGKRSSEPSSSRIERKSNKSKTSSRQPSTR